LHISFNTLRRPPGARPFCRLCVLCRDSLRGQSLMNLDRCFVVVWPQRQTFVRILLTTTRIGVCPSRRPTVLLPERSSKREIVRKFVVPKKSSERPAKISFIRKSSKSVRVSTSPSSSRRKKTRSGKNKEQKKTKNKKTQKREGKRLSKERRQKACLGRRGRWWY